MYRRRNQGIWAHYDFILLDICALFLSFEISCLVRLNHLNLFSLTMYRNLFFLTCLLELITVIIMGSYDDILKRNRYQEISPTLRHTLVLYAFLFVYLFAMQHGEAYSRSIIFSSAFLFWAISYCFRLFRRRYLRSKRKGLHKRSMIILTERSIANQVWDIVENHNYEGFSLNGVAYLDHEPFSGSVRTSQVIGNLDTVLNYICEQWVDDVLIVTESPSNAFDPFIKSLECMGVAVHTALAKEESLEGQVRFVEKFNGYTVLTSSINYVSTFKLMLKRALDIFGGLVGCLFTLLLYLIIAPKIKKESPGPVFFSQQRIGRNGKKFKMYKFRSMYLDAEARKEELMKENRVKDGMMFKLDWDPRVIGNRMENGEKKTGIGDFIRRTSIDEFPQFFNVLKGDMSLVGTRPPTVDEWEKYELHHRARMAVKPGITGMWQVSGRSDITDFEEVVRLDTKYIMNWSLSLDIKILCKTFLGVLKKDGAM